MQCDSRGLEELLYWNRARLAVSECICESRQLLEMTLVRSSRRPQDFVIACAGQTCEIIDNPSLAIGKNLDTLLRQARPGSERRIRQIADTAILIADSRAKVIVAAVGPCTGVNCLGVDGGNWSLCEETEDVVHMTGFANIAAATIGAVDPVVERNVS